MGYEYRNIECRIELDTPEPGRKRIVRLDTGEEVKTVMMTDADRQTVLDLQEAADKEEQSKFESISLIRELMSSTWDRNPAAGDT